MLDVALFAEVVHDGKLAPFRPLNFNGQNDRRKSDNDVRIHANLKPPATNERNFVQIPRRARTCKVHQRQNAKPFSTTSAYRICQCRSDQCEKIVDMVLEEFFKISEIGKDTWVHKRLKQEHIQQQKLKSKTRCLGEEAK